jgi:hypothetical protein
MKSTLQRIQEIRRTGYNLDLGEVINDSFSNYKSIALLGGAVILLVAFVAIVVFGGLTALLLGVDTFTQAITDFSHGTSSSTVLIIDLVTTVIFTALFAPIAAGLIQMAHNASIKEEFDFGTAFMHYSSEHFKELFLGAAIIALFGSGLTSIIELLKVNTSENLLTNIATAITAVISLLIQIFTLIMIPLIIFGKLKAVEAIKGSFILISKNFWTALLLFILGGIFVILGIFALCIGIIFTIPFLYSLQYIIYKKYLPIDETNEINEIGNNFY